MRCGIVSGFARLSARARPSPHDTTPTSTGRHRMFATQVSSRHARRVRKVITLPGRRSPLSRYSAKYFSASSSEKEWGCRRSGDAVGASKSGSTSR
jgi:hypothetical protein